MWQHYHTLLLLIALLCNHALSKGNTVVYDLTVKMETVQPDGHPRSGIVFYFNNGPDPKTPLFPGPTIYAKVGDEIVFRITNGLFGQGTSVHFHGLYFRDIPYLDGAEGITQCPIPPSASFEYRFVVLQSGTYLYHAHSSAQLPEGFYGAVVIYDREHPPGIPSYGDDRVVAIHAWSHYLSMQMLPLFFEGKIDPDEAPVHATLMNGLGVYVPSPADKSEAMYLGTKKDVDMKDIEPRFSVVHVARGGRARIRFVNMSPASHYIISIDHHNMTVIEVDGTLVKPFVVGSLSLDTAQRYSVLIDTTCTIGDGNFWIRASPALSEEVPAGYGILRYSNAPDENPNTSDKGYPRARTCLIKETLEMTPLIPFPLPRATRSIHLHGGPLEGSSLFQFNNMPWMMADTPIYQSLVTNTKWQGPASQLIELQYGEVVDLIITNDDTGPTAFHPIHLHGHSFWVLGIGLGAWNEKESYQTLNTIDPVIRDVQQLPPGGWIVIRFVADNPGVWLMHCHMEWHFELGFAIAFVEAPDRLPPLPKGFPRCGSYV